MGQFFVDLLNVLIAALGTVLSAITLILPDSPFTALSNTDVQDYLSGLAWVIPFDSIITELELWITAVIGYYAVMVILRWIKAMG